MVATRGIAPHRNRWLRILGVAFVMYVLSYIDRTNIAMAIPAMRTELGKVHIRGRVVIGEGEMDESPMLYIGEEVGMGDGPEVDIAVDPLEGTTICAKAMPNALAVLAIAERGGLLNAPDMYMNKIAIGPGYPEGILDLDAPPGDTLNAMAKARGVLVFPAVVDASLGVGAGYGRGALRVNGRTQAYYSTTAASLGLQAGAQSKAVVHLFNTQQALDKFRNSNGWVAGADATVAFATIGANGSVDTNTIQKPVVGFVLTNVGLEAGASVQGAKVSEIQL